MHNMTPEQSRMARAALNWNLETLAFKSGVSRNTISRFEAGNPANKATITAMRLTLEAAGVIFIDQNGEGPGVRLKKTP
ncbi:helix-turn-helix domain-containing protein [Oleispirillum naphthae]|uniref:helix-turn-helix domain-containing protein n=1 Tax=Oleispirillum naphthae TaxID=2838853 RepID=UPI003B67F849